MAQTRAGELSASMAILGLVIQEVDSVSGIARRLEERFAQARFARNAAHNNLPGLARQGLVRLVAAGSERGFDRYEATPEGLEHFRAWMRASQQTLPAMRDALRVALEHIACEPELRASIELMKLQEQECLSEHQAALRRVRAREAGGTLRAAGDPSIHAAVQQALMLDEATYWAMRAMRLKRLRTGLENWDEGLESCDDG
jgi:DNA-binding PadR family transcriptional regulator